MDGSTASAGQAPDDPVQSSATSHWPASARHVNVLGWNASTQVFADPLQWSVASHAPPVDVPEQVVVVGSKASAGQAPEAPVHSSATSHWPASARHVNVLGWKASTQAFADPLQWSVASHAPPVEVPEQVVVDGSNRIRRAGARRSGAKLRHVALTGIGSAREGRRLEDVDARRRGPANSDRPRRCRKRRYSKLPTQAVAAGSKASAGQAPDDPVQSSATSHWPASARHVNVLGWKASTQVFADPLQWSVASHAPPVEVPEQVVVDGSTASAGQVPDDPVQSSATSHWPASARHVNVLGWKASTQVFADPLQWSVASHAPPVDVPEQVVVVGSKASAGQAPDDPVQNSATSHWPASARHVNVLGWKTSTQVFADPLQWSVASHAPPVEVPEQVVVDGSNASAGQAPDEPVQSSATSH